MPEVPAGCAPTILEIGHIPYIYTAFPDTTEYYSTQYDQPEFDPVDGRRIISVGSMIRLARRLRDREIDLVVAHTMASAPWSGRALLRALFRRTALQRKPPLVRGFGQQLLRGAVSAPIVALDFDDPPVIDTANLFLMDRATFYFKRELPVDHWQAFLGTAHWRVPTPRFRMVQRFRDRVAKLMPLSLGLPFEVWDRRADWPDEETPKTIDVFFAGRVRGSSTQREHGMAELDALRSEGVTVDVPDKPLPVEEYLQRCARAWLVWSPPGYGWQCFRMFEAPICGSVPLLTHPTVERHQPLIEGEHALYYDPEPGGLTRAVHAALADRARLHRMARAARRHVLAHHTPPAIARHVVRTALEAAGRTTGLGL